ncbi:MAG: hypothetical protein A2008_07395 [Candidatus Wallbacteria bacterium GWC2_49_35]|uniref:Glycosyl transferase family 1 domain-containing protein n=1 Tax=Candidatus Wallbacteria bacterium GWC2_49_35 TaxID=1817813 RepID=A0A1F7WEF9_9BACT|nr:MAG: hypothetical protein A2008_07395 [Candidatus Wallbacteria bacterium GWC2_49_35]
MRKVLIVSSLYPTAANPGYGIFVKNCEDGLAENGFVTDHAVIGGSPSGWLHKLFLYAFFYARALYKGLFNDYDILYGHFVSHICLPLYLIALVRKPAMVINIHGSDILVEGGIRRFIYSYFLAPLIKKILRGASLVITPSRQYRKILASKFGVDGAKIFVSPSGGIDAQKFRALDKNECRRKLGLDEKEFVIGYVSRIEKNKGWQVLVEAVSDLKKTGAAGNFKALVVGKGSEVNKFKEKVSALGLEKEIMHIENTVRDELSTFYSASDIFIFPTLKESLGLVGIEAMACGAPVIGSRIEALGEYLIDGVTGFFFDAGSPSDLSEKITLYYKLSVEKKRKLSDNALKMAVSFDSKLTAKKLSEKFSTLQASAPAADRTAKRF